jgi:hypothetical protein
LNRAKGEGTNFLTAIQFLQMLKIDQPKMGQIKEVCAVLREHLGKERKTLGNNGWNIPMIDI